MILVCQQSSCRLLKNKNRMSLDITLFVMRIAVALILYAFLGTLLFMIWRDIKTIDCRFDENQRLSGRLTVLDSENMPLETGQTFSLRRLTTLGRGPTNTLVFPDSFVSTFHALIVYRGGQWWLQDQQSRNGTLLNDMPLNEAVVLSSGDIIGIGRTKLRVELD